MCRLGHGDKGEGVPLLFDGWVGLHVYEDLIGETLAKVALHDFVFMLPLLSLLLLCISGFIQVLGNRGLVEALEVAPATRKYHCPAKAMRKCCPVYTVRVKVWDIDE
jgi:hypothetical protein